MIDDDYSYFTRQERLFAYHRCLDIFQAQRFAICESSLISMRKGLRGRYHDIVDEYLYRPSLDIWEYGCVDISYTFNDFPEWHSQRPEFSGRHKDYKVGHIDFGWSSQYFFPSKDYALQIHWLKNSLMLCQDLIQNRG